MKVDTYSSGSKPDWYLIMPAGVSYQPQVDDLKTGVGNMVPLYPHMTNVNLETVVPVKSCASYEHDLLKYGGAVIREKDYLAKEEPITS